MQVDPRYLLHDVYIDDRRAQDVLLHREFGSVRDSIDSVENGLIERLNQVEGRLDGRLNRLENRLEKGFIEFRAGQLRSDAYMRNAAVKKSSSRIYPFVVYNEADGTIHEPQHFPENWQQFDSLRNPSSNSLLLYLANFYDIPYNINDDEAVIDDPDRVVAALVDMHGLDEDNITNITNYQEERIQERAWRVLQRPQLGTLAPDAQQRRRELRELRPAAAAALAAAAAAAPAQAAAPAAALAAALDLFGLEAEAKPQSISSEEVVSRVGWKVGPRSTPSSQRQTVNRIRGTTKPRPPLDSGSSSTKPRPPLDSGSSSTKPRPPAPDSGGSPTNPNTSSGGSDR